MKKKKGMRKMIWMEMSYNSVNRNIKEAENSDLVIGYDNIYSWEMLRELELETCRFAVEDVYCYGVGKVYGR
ncbi:MAG: hypothetical protein BV457_06085 [Thermoplasmata archaeon M9B1D]|nr:MAG: hypothetical protein BV457_06085 [Thermoplasmata archaeon M9B1D]